MSEERMERRLAAILAADIAGYSALMGADEARTVRDLKGQTDLSRFRGTFHSFDPVGFAIITLLPSRRLAACIIAMSVEPRKIGEAACRLSQPSTASN
jgi:hypothetical protein